MSRTTLPHLACAFLAAATAVAVVRAQVPTTPPPAVGRPSPPATPQAANRYLATHHIDRYEAILQVRQALIKDPKNLNDWIILGELSQEVAADVPSNEAGGYYKLARESYESALRLKPGDANLKAAAQFARDQEQAADRVAQARRQSAASYLAARRRELSAPGAGPILRVYAPPVAPAATPYYYQPYTTAGGQPYTYQQYSRLYYTEGGVPVEANHPIGATERAALVKPADALAPP